MVDNREDGWMTPVRWLAVILLTVALIVGVVGYLVDIGRLSFSPSIQTLVLAFYANVSAELASIILTILVIDALNDQRVRDQEKRRLILQMGSPDNSFAREAARQIRAAGWLSDGSLRKASLVSAGLQQTDLNNMDCTSADLSGSNFSHSTLHGADLEGCRMYGTICKTTDFNGANMNGAFLADVDLQEAKLINTNLSNALLQKANLQESTLTHTDFTGADLSYANLRGARSLTAEQLQAARTLAGAILPEGTQLPADDSWHDAFEQWHQQVFINRKGFIVPTKSDDSQTLNP